MICYWHINLICGDLLWMSKTFCPIPWLFQAPRANGDLRICCQANNSKTSGIIRKQDGTPFNAGVDDLNESRNADLMKIVRKNMLDGIWSDECSRCQQEEQNGEYSRRLYELDNWSYNFTDALKDTTSDGTINTASNPVKYYDFRFGNKCNLACRMCGPTDSDYWYDDWIKLRGTNEFQDNGSDKIIIGKDDPYSWHSNESFWEQIESNIQNIEHIYFAGGEPLLIQRHYDFLEKCVNEDHACHITLEYNTNLTTLPPRVINLWTQFKQVRVGISIDGYGDVFEYQRYPAKWDKVYNNILKMDRMPHNIESWFAFTVSAYNVEHLPDFMKWSIEQNFKRVNINKPIVTHHMVHAPHHLNIKVLPKEYKLFVTEKLLDFSGKIRDNKYKRISDDIIHSVIRFMNSEDYEAKYGVYFAEYTRRLDRIRNQNISDVVPNLAAHIENRGND